MTGRVQLALLPDDSAPALPDGVRLLRRHLDENAQRRLLDVVLAAVEGAGWVTPTMPRTGRPYSVRMCNLGPLGWVSDSAGYRYQPAHPVSGRPWPPMPPELAALWRDVAGYSLPAECCLVNQYGAGARMGLHQDRDEQEMAAPVVSVSLGDEAVFRIGGTERRGSTSAMRLRSGDVLTFGGPSRLRFHGIDRVVAGTSDLVPGGGRVNLTLRRVTSPTDR